MSREEIKAIAIGITFTLFTGIVIFIGSRNLTHFDAALVGYTFSVMFAVFGIAYRYSMWLQRPPTALYWRRGWQTFLNPKYLFHNFFFGSKKLVGDFALNQFIFHRNRLRGIAHWCIMWGCIIAIGITFPLVFGWIHFETLPDNMEWYRTYVFGFPTFAFPIHSLPGFMIFHGLVWASVLVIIGVLIALTRRLKDHGAAAVQQFGEDFLPLILLFAVSTTGLMLTASYSWMKGYGYDFLAILHAITVIFTLLWLPFGKFFHIFQRPAQLGVSFYKEIGKKEGQAKCFKCGEEYASAVHVQDLMMVQKKLGYKYELNDEKVDHYQRICPACRRRLMAVAQGKLWQHHL